MAGSFTRLITGATLGAYRFAKRRAALCAATARLAPYLAGPLFIIPASDSEMALDGWKRYAAVVILFFFWERLVRTATRVRAEREQRDFLASQPTPKKAGDKRNSSKMQEPNSPSEPSPGVSSSTWSFTRWDMVWIILSGILIILTLDLFRSYFIEVIFALVLLTFTCGALAGFLQREAPQHKQRYLLGLSPQFIYLTGIGYLTCLALGGDLIYQPLVISASLAAVAMTPPLLKQIIKNVPAETANQSAEHRYLVRALALLVCFAPVALALLAYGGELHERYLSVFLCFIPGSPLLRRLQKSQSVLNLDPDLEWLGAATVGIFLGTLAILRLF